MFTAKVVSVRKWSSWHLTLAINEKVSTRRWPWSVALFRAFWIERPTAGTGAVVVHGLVDSESATGAVRMTFRPGEITIVDVETTLFPRVTLEHVGLGGMGATFLFGPNVRRTTDDVRPAVYEASGT